MRVAIVCRKSRKLLFAKSKVAEYAHNTLYELDPLVKNQCLDINRVQKSLIFEQTPSVVNPEYLHDSYTNKDGI